jgi:hypothetical protein
MMTDASTVCIGCGERFTPSEPPRMVPAPKRELLNDPPAEAPWGAGPEADGWAAPGPDAPTTTQTSACGHTNPPGQPFCSTCGANVSTGVSATGGGPGYAAGGPGHPGYGGGGPGYSPYAQPGYSMPGPVPTNKRARNALILGIVAFFCCGVILGPAAIVEGTKARKEIAQWGGMEGDGMALAGIICGAIATALNLLGIIVQVIILSADSSTSGY